MASSAARRWELRDARADDVLGIESLLGGVFGPTTAARWSWRYQRSPYPSAVLVAVDAAGEVVGHLGGIRVDATIDHRPATVALHGDLGVADAARGQGLAAELLAAMAARWPLTGLDLRYHFPAAHASAAVGRAGSTQPVAHLPQWVRWLHPDALRASRHDLAGRRSADLAWHILRVTRRLRAGPVGVTAEPLDQLGDEVDALADRSASFARCVARRDSRHLRWRWLDQPCSDWALVGARGRGGDLEGVAVYGIEPERLHGGRPVGRVGDLLAMTEGATVGLLEAASAELASRGCGLVLFELVDPRPWARRACLRAGFLQRGRGPIVHLAVTEDCSAAGSIGNWLLTAGDTDLV